MNHAPLNNYLHNEFSNVNGWCIAQLWNCVEPILDYHREIGLEKPICEIGVYQGKFFIGLLKSIQSNQKSHAIDVFSMQQFNLDGAGVGSKEKVEQNLSRCGVHSSTYSLNEVDSMTLSESRLREIGITPGQFSYFSIDGCHTPEHTINDIKLAIELTCPEGIIFVDDYHNPSWPGVQEGVAKYLFHEYSKFVPLLFTCNKLFLCHISFHAIFLSKIHAHLKENYVNTVVKPVKRFGYDTLTVIPNLNDETYLKSDIVRINEAA